MAFDLQDIDPETDFPVLARCLLEAYEDPPQRFLHIFFPVNGPGAEAREAAIQEAAARLKSWHTHDPSSYWQKVVDTETGNLAGAAAWNIYKTNPFAEAHPVEVTWFPDEASRTFAEKALEIRGRPRYQAAQRPHVCMSPPFTLAAPDLAVYPLFFPPVCCSLLIRPVQRIHASELPPPGRRPAGHGLGHEQGR
jgi:hypothetical protein